MTKLLYPLILLLLIGCIKDNSGFKPDNNGSTGQTFIADIYGVVLDEHNLPIEDVSVLFNGKYLKTDDYGVFRYKQEKINSKHNFITISKDGFYTYIQNFRASDISTISLRIPLVKTNYVHSFSSTVISSFDENELVLNIEPNSFNNAQTGIQYNGQVELSLKYLNPMDQEVRKYISGNLSAINSQKIVGTLNSFGLVLANFKTHSGDKLELSSNTQMEISIKIPSSQLNVAPNEISMWVFDESDGLWIQKNKAKKIGSRYIGFVDATGYWNFGSFQQSILLNSTFVDQSNSMLSDLDIVLSVVNSELEMHTISEGIFSSYIPKGELLELKVFNRNKCNATPLLSKTIGPFEKDINLGEIKVPIEDDKYIKIKGNFLDCTGIPISNGHVRLNNNSIYPLNNGLLNLTIPMCDVETIELEVTDRMNKKTSGISYLESPGDYDLGKKTVCQDAPYFITTSCLVLDYEEIFHYDCQLMDNSSTKEIIGAHYDRNNVNKIGEFIKLVFDSQNNKPLQKEHKLNSSKIVIMRNGQLRNAMILPGGKVWIDNGLNVNDIIQGRYRVLVHFDGDPQSDSYTFEGNYLLPYK